MQRSRLAIVAVLVGLVATFFLLRPRDEAERSGGAPVKLTIASVAYPRDGKQVFSGLTQIVIEQGWLKSELAGQGVALDFLPVPTAIGAPIINEGFAGKRIDFASYGDFPAIIANAGGIETRLVVPAGQGQNVYLVVRNGLAANSIADLKGKRIALHRGRPWELPFAKLLDQNGLKFDDFRILNINPPASAAALASGDVDAVVLLSDGLLLEQRKLGRVIWSTRQAPPDWRMRAELFGRKDFIEANPALTQLVATAYVRAADWASREENRDRVLDIAARGDAPRSVVEAEYADPSISWKDRFSPLFDANLRTHYRAAADYTFQNGLVRSKVDADALLEPRFVAQALRQLKLEGHWQ